MIRTFSFFYIILIYKNLLEKKGEETCEERYKEKKKESEKDKKEKIESAKDRQNKR